jgi:membrane protein
VPVSSEYLLPIVEDVTEARGTLGVIAAVGALFSSTTVFSAIRKGINHAWHIEKPPYFLVERGQDMLMLIGVVVLAAIEVLSSTNLLGAYSLAEALNGPLETLILEAAARLLVLSVTFGTVSLMFRFLPNAPVLWREVWLGAAITSVCLHAIGFAFSTFFSSIGNFNLVYGSLGALMAMLMWAYLSAFSIMLGAQVCYGFSKSLGPRAEPEYLGSPSASGSDEGSERKKLSEQIKSWLMPPTGKH